MTSLKWFLHVPPLCVWQVPFQTNFSPIRPQKRSCVPPKFPIGQRSATSHLAQLGQQAKKEAERKKAEAEGRQIEEEEEETKERHVEAELKMDVFWSSGEPMDGLNSGLIILSRSQMATCEFPHFFFSVYQLGAMGWLFAHLVQ